MLKCTQLGNDYVIPYTITNYLPRYRVIPKHVQEVLL